MAVPPAADGAQPDPGVAAAGGPPGQAPAQANASTSAAQPQPVPDPERFRLATGRDPVTPDEWRVAATLDPQFGESSTPAEVHAVRITPTPGGGYVYSNAFIAEKDVEGPPHDLLSPLDTTYLGDNRGFDPAAGPQSSRVSTMIDFENGLAIVRQNPSRTDAGAVGVNSPVVGVEQDPSGRVRLRLQASDGLLPRVAGDLGGSVRSDAIVDPRGATGGNPSLDGKVTQYPTWEAYGSRPGQPQGTLLQRPENADSAAGPLQLVKDSVNVGQRPELLDQWRQQYHRDQVEAAGLRAVVNPFSNLRDSSFYDYPLPEVPEVLPDGRGGVTIPEVRQVR